MRSWLREALLRLKSFTKRRQFEGDLDDEFAFHLAERERRNRESGLPADAAR
jgi:hypothetical protein